MRHCGLGQEVVVYFNDGKMQLVLLDRSNDTGIIDVKMDGSILEEKSSFKKLGLTFFSKFDWGYYIISIAKTPSKKIGALRSFHASFSCNSIPCSDCSALHGVNLN